MSQSNIDQQNDSGNKLLQRAILNNNNLQQTPSPLPFFDDSLLFNQDPFQQYIPISEIKQEDNNFSKLLESNNQSLNNTRSYQEINEQKKVQPFENYSNQSQSQISDGLDQNINHMTIYCNQSLKSFGYSQLGNLINPRQEDIMQTLNSVYELLQQRQRDMEFRSSIAEKSAKLEQNYKISQEKNEKYQVEAAKMKKQIGSLENQITTIESKTKKDIQKLTLERDELQKNLQKLQQKSNQMQNEIRKKESETNRVKEQMKKLTSDKFDKNSVFRNTIDLISQHAGCNNTNNSQHPQKPWKNNASEEFADCINQQAIQFNNKLLSENQAFRNTLIQLNNDLNNFIKQAKEEYIRKKIKEEGDKDENLKDYYQQKLPDIDLIYFKDDCLNLPYERVGSMVVDIFKENFKVIKLFLASISSLIYSHNYYHELGKELDKIKENLLKIRNNIDVTKILFTDKSVYQSSYTVEGFDNNSNLNQKNDAKKNYIEITDFKQGNTEGDYTLQSSIPQNTRTQSSNKSLAKNTINIINNNTNSTNNPSTPSLQKNSSTGRNVSQNRGQAQDKQKTNISKQNNQSNNNNQNSNSLNLIKKDSQVQQSRETDNKIEEKYLNSYKIEQMIKEKLNARLKTPLLQTTSQQNSSQMKNENKINNDDISQINKNKHLRENLLSDRSNLNELEAFLSNYQYENFNFNQESDKTNHTNNNNNNNNNDLSLSFVSRVSFRDVPYGGIEFDEKMIEGLGINHREIVKGGVDPKIQFDMKKWQNILSASSSDANLLNTQNTQIQSQNDQKSSVVLKDLNQGGQQQQHLQTLNGVDANINRNVSKK
ncbi:afadin- and alpha-actinin-binding protein (macronuclear) [Tetrahymena thermophila SB210]|uniref:Afadin-and alpha-actinin-binding protein n=1 Tax=Tetrahymena thermophila (strain SB210) TaxID=312017 RepID=I7LZK3_TETTS|nr:afadin- and alpha-actinin-binding protein [Tetrahymena thermophila SB210]EAR84093.1 afadin- and alpha-actinin-binding protein [Tetrahymena thermophila SB210]|eukprot:XP_001031756.1 afadin- and alpha-actinin-binding protein [Tetrahymena thermophila SB210]